MTDQIKLDEEALDAAWRVLAPDDDALTDIIDSGNLRAAIAAYLSTMQAKGMRMMPKEPTEEMARRGADVRHVQDSLSRAKSASIDTREIWRQMFDSFDAGAKP